MIHFQHSELEFSLANIFQHIDVYLYINLIRDYLQFFNEVTSFVRMSLFQNSQKESWMNYLISVFSR